MTSPLPQSAFSSDIPRISLAAKIDLRLSSSRGILKSPIEYRILLDNSRLGMIGFDGNLFVAGKRAENVGSARG